MTQSRRHSACESLANTAIGFGVAMAAQIMVFPLFGIRIGIADNAAISVIFTGISIVRGYVVRRAFNRWHARGI